MKLQEVISDVIDEEFIDDEDGDDDILGIDM